MRDTKEIAEAVFRIRDEYNERMRMKRIRMRKICAAASTAAAAVLIVFGAAHFNHTDTEIVLNNDEITIAVTTAAELPEKYGTDTCVTSVPVSSQTRTAASETAPAQRTTAAPVIQSSAPFADVHTVPSVSAMQLSSGTARSAAYADTIPADSTVTTGITENDHKEVINLKVQNIKKYIAAISAAAVAASAAQLPANAQSIYTPNPLSSFADAILFIEDDSCPLDINGNGKTDSFDSYAFYTYINEPASLPEGFAEKITANGDLYKDGKVNEWDYDIFKNYCFMKFTYDDFDNYANEMQYIIASSRDPYARVERKVSPDAPEDVKEMLMNNVFVDESYTYGSPENKKNFMNFCFNSFSLYSLSEYDNDCYQDAYYKRFVEAAEADNISFDVNEDGNVDLYDLYDMFIYDTASSDDNHLSRHKYRFDTEYMTEDEDGNPIVYYKPFDGTLRSNLQLPEEYKQMLWDNCGEIYDYIEPFMRDDGMSRTVCLMYALDYVARYIMSNTDLDLINTNQIYYIQYHDILTLGPHDMSEIFTEYMQLILHKYFYNTAEDQSDHSGRKESPKFAALIEDNPYMHDNEVLMAVNAKAKAELESGETADLYDLNKDGKIDYKDEFIFTEYSCDLANGLTAEESLIPADYWNFIDQNVDLDKDGIPGTFIDYTVFRCVTLSDEETPQYLRDVYYLELLEQKGIIDLNELRPYIEKLCADKDAGDVDLDGMVTASDASMVLGYYADSSVDAEISQVTVAQMQYMADLNNDGYVDCADATDILSTYASNSVAE